MNRGGEKGGGAGQKVQERDLPSRRSKDGSAAIAVCKIQKRMLMVAALEEVG